MKSDDKILKMGFSITDLCGILKGIANRQDNDEMWRTVNKVQEMQKAEWSSKVSSRVQKSKKRKRLNKVQVLPRDDDIKKLSDGLRQTIKDLLEEMEANGANVKLGNELIGASLVYFILFNRKRSGEVMWILRKNFEDAKNIDLKKEPECLYLPLMRELNIIAVVHFCNFLLSKQYVQCNKTRGLQLRHCKT